MQSSILSFNGVKHIRDLIKQTVKTDFSDEGHPYTLRRRGRSEMDGLHSRYALQK